MDQDQKNQNENSENTESISSVSNMGNMDLPKTNVSPDSKPLDIEKKEKEVKRKHFFFITAVVLGTFLIIVPITVIVGIKIREKYFSQNEPIVQEEQQQQPPQQEEEITVKKYIQHRSDLFKVNLDYPTEATLSEKVEPESQIKKTQIVFSGTSQPANEITESTLQEGYIFQISTFKLSTTDLDEMAAIKTNSFKSKCPTTAQLSEIMKTTLDNMEARTFEVFNCNVDYKVTYLQKFGVYYEFLQVYKGDYGVKQRYKAKTEEILSTVDFYPTEDELATYVTYVSDRGFSFKHPKYNTTCCDIPGPASTKANKVVVAAKEGTINGSIFDGFGVFLETLDYQNTDFNKYLQEERNKLVENYIIAKGEKPQPEEKVVRVDGKDGILFKGYSWQGNDLIYVYLQKDQSKKVMVISVNNTTGEDFEEEMNTILSSFNFE